MKRIQLYNDIFFLLFLAYMIVAIGLGLTLSIDISPKEDIVKAEIEKIPPQKVSTLNIYVEPKIDKTVIHKEPEKEVEEKIEEEIEELETEVYIVPNGQMLTASLGRVQGPTNEETYYNLPMEKVIEKMRTRGYSEQDYPFYIREDGVKMLGDFVIVAALLDKHPRGTVVSTSLGQGIVCDTGIFEEDIYDIATDW